jgi:hypothetical protein
MPSSSLQDVTAGGVCDCFKDAGADPGNRLALIFGAGEQIATSHYHSYNHGLIFSARVAF